MGVATVVLTLQLWGEGTTYDDGEGVERDGEG